MKYIILVVAALVFCSLHGALGIICKKCTPDQASRKTCIQAGQLTEVNCDNETFPFNVTEGTKYDACAKSTVVAVLGGQKIQTYVMSCAVKTSSSNPSVVNCSIVEDYVCGDARRRAAASGSYTIDSCSSVCCLGNSCNGVDPDMSTAASTTAASGVNEVQPSCLGMLLMLVVISVLMKKVA